MVEYLLFKENIMKYIEVKHIFNQPAQYFDKEITIAGWVRSVRASNAFGFMVINDGTCFSTIQVVMNSDLENYKVLSKVNVGAAVIVKGLLVQTPEAKQPFEIQATAIEIEGDSASDYPLQKKRHGFEFLRTIAHLRPRTNTFAAVFRVRSLTAFAIHKFFVEQLIFLTSSSITSFLIVKHL